MSKLVLCCVLAASLLGCGNKEKTAESCGPLTVTIDGKPLPAMPNGFARKNIMQGDSNYEIEVFNHAKTTCEEMVSNKGRNVHEGEVSVRAFAGGEGMMAKGVGIESHTQAGGNVYIVGPKPKAAGDVVQICADNVSFKPHMGSNQNKPIKMNGLLTGKYCGEMKF
ncbi:MAG: hypothetical protein H0T89_06630 [Deltaproteobacteria bacterium]|nr:hypothetical protein [Deltaproteobacteria bacterium]MDQ3297858.1 hypothetical protein [Myxococcota bacterium]